MPAFNVGTGLKNSQILPPGDVLHVVNIHTFITELLLYLVIIPFVSVTIFNEQYVYTLYPKDKKYTWHKVDLL